MLYTGPNYQFSDKWSLVTTLNRYTVVKILGTFFAHWEKNLGANKWGDRYTEELLPCSRADARTVKYCLQLPLLVGERVSLITCGTPSGGDLDCYWWFPGVLSPQMFFSLGKGTNNSYWLHFTRWSHRKRKEWRFWVSQDWKVYNLARFPPPPPLMRMMDTLTNSNRRWTAYRVTQLIDNLEAVIWRYFARDRFWWMAVQTLPEVEAQ